MLDGISNGKREKERKTTVIHTKLTNRYNALDIFIIYMATKYVKCVCRIWIYSLCNA